MTNASAAPKSLFLPWLPLLIATASVPGEAGDLGLGRQLCDDADPVNRCDDPGRPQICRCTDHSLEITFAGENASNVLTYEEFEPGLRITTEVVLNAVSGGVGSWALAVAHDPDAVSLSEDDITMIGTDAHAHFGFGDPFSQTKVVVTEQANGTVVTGYIHVFVVTTIVPIDPLPAGRHSLVKATYTLLRDVGTEGTTFRFANNVLAVPNSVPVEILLSDNLIARQPRRVVDGLVRRAALFRRGDADGDQRLTISDGLIAILATVGGLGEAELRSRFGLYCQDALDANDDGSLTLADGISVLSYLFVRGAPLPPPVACGPDSTADRLGCEDASPVCR